MEPARKDDSQQTTSASLSTTSESSTANGQLCGHCCENEIKRSTSAWSPSICDSCMAENRAEHERREAETLLRQRAAVVKERLKSSGLPLSTFERRELVLSEPLMKAKTAIDCAIEGSAAQPWLLVTGDPGVGKTSLVCRAAAAWIRRGGGFVQYAVFGDVLLRIRDAFRPHSKISELDVIRDFRGAPVLVLDDIGAEQATQFVASTLFNILDHRYQRASPTVLISNHAPGKLAARLACGDDRVVADRIADRIIEMAIWLPIKGESFRAKLANETRDFDWSISAGVGGDPGEGH
jgi:DNA replication protein DnaC